MAALLKQFEPELSRSCLEPTQFLQLLDETLPGESRAAANLYVDRRHNSQEHLAARTSDAGSRRKVGYASPISTAQVISQLKSRGLPALDAGPTTDIVTADTVSDAALEAEDRRDREFMVDLLPDGAQRFRPLGVLGEGGMAVVFRCRDACSGQEVAVKVLRHRHTTNEEIVEQFFRETRIQTRLAHTHVAGVLEAGTLADARPYSVMEYRRGHTLAQQIHRAKSGSNCDLLDVFRQLCEAMAYAHRQGVVHRDLKPSNILVGHRGEVTVLDWGLSDERAAGALPGMTPYTPVSIPCFFRHVAGTPGYVAPEQIKGASIEPTADVYSLGVILAEILTGERLPPIAQFTDDELEMEQAAAGIVATVRRSGAPAELVDLVDRCLSVAPADRLSDAGKLLAEWERLVSAGRRDAVSKGAPFSPRLLSMDDGYKQIHRAISPVRHNPHCRPAAMNWRDLEEDGCKKPTELAFVEGRQKADTSLHRTKRQLSECELCRTYSKFSRAHTSAPKFCSPPEKRSSAAVTNAISYSTTG